MHVEDESYELTPLETVRLRNFLETEIQYEYGIKLNILEDELEFESIVGATRLSLSKTN